ncbi:MAG: hypothetical protein U1E51_07110 [Candidatus Binatia bacterium]|nr:hypothetical protein [Candidatus Binatia bacterium]
MICPEDGDQLRLDGYCSRGGGFPFLEYGWFFHDEDHKERGKWKLAPRTCLFVCEVCSEKLGWNGGCTACHGSTHQTDRSAWQFTGDYYAREGGHRVKQAGPTLACTREENRDLMRGCFSLIAGANPDSVQWPATIDEATKAEIKKIVGKQKELEPVPF